MAEVLLFHHVQGLTNGVKAFADELREAGHTVHAPDLFDGRTFASIEDGFGYVREVGGDTIQGRVDEAVSSLGPDLVYAGFSYGVPIAQELAQTKPGARGALLIYSCIPVSEYGDAWPAGVPVQVHGKEGDEFFDEDLPAARELVASTSDAELFLYPGDEHLFADSSLPGYDAEAAGLLMERVKELLARV